MMNVFPSYISSREKIFKNRSACQAHTLLSEAETGRVEQEVTTSFFYNRHEESEIEGTSILRHH